MCYQISQFCIFSKIGYRQLHIDILYPPFDGFEIFQIANFCINFTGPLNVADARVWFLYFKDVINQRSALFFFLTFEFAETHTVLKAKIAYFSEKHCKIRYFGLQHGVCFRKFKCKKKKQCRSLEYDVLKVQKQQTGISNIKGTVKIYANFFYKLTVLNGKYDFHSWVYIPLKGNVYSKFEKRVKNLKCDIF